MLLSTAGSSLHTARRHVSSLNFIYPSRTALPADIYISLFELWALQRFLLRGRLASDNKRQEWLQQHSSWIFQQFVLGWFCMQLRFVCPNRCCVFNGAGEFQRGHQRTQARWTALASEGVISLRPAVKGYGACRKVRQGCKTLYFKPKEGDWLKKRKN